MTDANTGPVTDGLTELLKQGAEATGKLVGEIGKEAINRLAGFLAMIPGLGAVSEGLALGNSKGPSYDTGFSPAASPAITPTLPSKQESIAQAQNIAVSLPSTALDMVKEIQINASTNITSAQSMHVVSAYDLGVFESPITPAVTGMVRGKGAGVGV